MKPVSTFNRNAVFWQKTRKTLGDELSKSSNTMENEFLRVTVNENGTLKIIDKESGKVNDNLNYFEDTGDCGDYWMYYPPHHNKTYTSLGCRAQIWVEENGSFSATIGTEITILLPACAKRPENEIRGQKCTFR